MAPTDPDPPVNTRAFGSDFEESEEPAWFNSPKRICQKYKNLEFSPDAREVNADSGQRFDAVPDAPETIITIINMINKNN
jgi:hypothetical protein